MARSHNKNQYGLPYDWRYNEAMAWLRAMLSRVNPASVGLSPHKWGQVREYVQAVGCFYFDDSGKRECTVSPERLMQTSRLERDRMYEARRIAVALGLIVIERRRYRGMTRVSDVLTLDLTAINRLAAAPITGLTAATSNDGSPSGKVASNPTDPDCNQPQLPATNRNQPQLHKRNIPLEPLKPLEPRNHSSTTVLTNSDATHAADTRQATAGCGARDARAKAAMREVVGEIYNLGVNAADIAVPAAVANGATSADIRSLGAYFDLHRDGWSHYPEPPAVLYRQLRRWRPGQAVDERWPAFNADYAKRLAREAAARQHEEDLARQFEKRRADDAVRAAIAAEPKVDIMAAYRDALRRRSPDERG